MFWCFHYWLWKSNCIVLYCICIVLRIWSHLLKKSLMGNFVFCAVPPWRIRVRVMFRFRVGGGGEFTGWFFPRTTYRASKLWKNVPEEVRNSDSLLISKKSIKWSLWFPVRATVVKLTSIKLFIFSLFKYISTSCSPEWLCTDFVCILWESFKFRYVVLLYKAQVPLVYIVYSAKGTFCTKHPYQRTVGKLQFNEGGKLKLFLNSTHVFLNSR